jgi:clan AA aspartic protease (TIGR02281 family)
MTSRQLIRSSTAIALVVFVCALTIAADVPPADVLKSNGLAKVGSLYLLDADVKLSDSLRELRRAETLLQTYTTKRRAIEADITKAEQYIIGWEREKVALHEQLSKTSTAQTQLYNQIIGDINKRNSDILEAAKYMQDRAAALKKLEAPTDHISVTLALAAKLEEAQKQYDLLATKEEIKSALAMLNEKSPIKFRLGPTATFKEQLIKLRRQRDAINNAVIKFEIRGGVPHVPAILNGTVVVPMVVDSGASLVTITTDVAKQLKLSASDDAEEITLTVADGKQVKAKLMTLDSIRVGQFSVKNVLCAVLPESAAAESTCLLGGTFLRHFIYQMDLSAGVLHLSPITAEQSKSTTEPLTPQEQAKAQPTSAPAPTTEQTAEQPVEPAAEASAEFTLEIRANIDGGEDVNVTSHGLVWKHYSGNWPSDVVVNGTKWNPQKKDTLPSADRLASLRNVDWSKATVVQRYGRGKLTMKKVKDGVLINFDDPDPGVEFYAIKISFSPSAD